MLTKSECLSVLSSIDANDGEVNRQIRALMSSPTIPVDVIRFIIDHKSSDEAEFYEMLRRQHNKQKSKIYTSILRDPESSADAALTLSCFLTQVMLYERKIENPARFFKSIRADEISAALSQFFLDSTSDVCIRMLRLIRADLLVFELASGRRERA